MATAIMIAPRSLAALEAVIARGRQAFIDVGEALLEVRGRRLYQEAGFTSFDGYCQRRWGFHRAQAYRLMDAAEVAGVLSPIGDTPPNEAVARELAPLTDDPQRLQAVWQEAQARAGAQPTAADVRAVVQQQAEGGSPPAALMSSESSEWYTLGRYLDAVRELLGAIDLDPASCELANRTVGARQIYTEENDGLAQPWHGRVFLNPPYGMQEGESNQATWTKRLLWAFTNSEIDEAVLLVNATPSNQWFRPLWDYPICFTDHRIRFYNAAGEAPSPTHSNAFVYLGPQTTRFVQIFSALGVVVRRLTVSDGDQEG